MIVSEPMTLATDYLLAVTVGWWGWRLWRDGRNLAFAARGRFGGALLAAAVAALLGGTVHGFVTVLPDTLHDLLWRATLLSIGISDLAFLLAANAALLRGAPARWLAHAAVAKCLLYSVWIIGHPQFHFAVYDYVPSLLLTLLLFGTCGRRRQPEAVPWLVGGLLLTFVAAVIQRSGLTLHRHFNHNDLYHLVQIAAFWLLYRGAGRLRPTA